jgi:Xaa-Pro aminopeptidase
MFEAHFQSFDDEAARGDSAPRVAALRAELARRGLDGFIVPRADRYQNEYVPPCAARLAFISGFSGSAGVAIVLADRAALFVDGRYQLQVKDEVDSAIFTIEHLVERPPPAWIEANLKAGQKLGYSPWLHTVDGAERLAKACAAAGASLAPVADNPLDAIWTDRPPPPLGAVVVHELKYAGEDAPEKLARVRAEIQKAKADALAVPDPQNVCWLFNIRGSDIPHTPVALAAALIPADGRPALYVDARQLGDDIRARLNELADLRAPDDFERDLAALGAGKRTVLLEPASCPEAIARRVADAGGKVLRGADPIAPMKAVKNETEIAGARAAHLRDGAALARFFAWFDAEAPSGLLTEIDAVEALESFRRDTGLLKDVSFPTIAGAGPNGAVVHYRVTRASNRRIAPGEIFLVDSGAQYEDGTTDVTRTVAVGSPNDAGVRQKNTLVLKGHIAIARAVFPEGTSGAQLDSFARQFLWRAGVDFDHGTGHGVGSYLSVHEGPARISKLGGAPLKRGMVLSNEPGYYRTGAYGIRIENLVLVVEAPAPADAEKALNGFETLTLAPIDRRLIEPAMLDADETAWLNAYHARVRAALAALVDAPTRAWLEAATEPLAR